MRTMKATQFQELAEFTKDVERVCFVYGKTYVPYRVEPVRELVTAGGESLAIIVLPHPDMST